MNVTYRVCLAHAPWERTGLTLGEAARALGPLAQSRYVSREMPSGALHPLTEEERLAFLDACAKLRPA